MYEDEIVRFGEALKFNMIGEAADIIKSTFEDLYYDTLLNERNDQFPNNFWAHLKTALIQHFHSIANEYNFKMDLNFFNNRFSSVQWYHNDIMVYPLNGIIKPIHDNITSKRNPIPATLRHEVFKRDDYRCLECGATNINSTLEVDHIIPVAQDGTDEFNNLQTLCIACNRAKSNRTWKGGQHNGMD